MNMAKASFVWLLRLSVPISACQMTTQAGLVQVPPIIVGIIDRDLVICFDSFGNQNDALRAQPIEPLELTIGHARVIDKLCVITCLALPDLIRANICLTLHDICVSKILGDQADELANSLASFERQACDQPIVATIWSSVDLSRTWDGNATI